MRLIIIIMSTPKVDRKLHLIGARPLLLQTLKY